MRGELITEGGEFIGSEDVRRITRSIRPLIALTAKQIFFSFREKLLEMPAAYVIAAVWGALEKNERLDDTQDAIHMYAQRTVTTAVNALQPEHMDRAQRFFIQFLVRELIIAKIFIRKASVLATNGTDRGLSLNALEPAGHA